MQAIDRALAEARTPEALQAVLREQWPRAVVRARDISSERETVWYAYRDGHWVPSIGGA